MNLNFLYGTLPYNTVLNGGVVLLVYGNIAKFSIFSISLCKTLLYFYSTGIKISKYCRYGYTKVPLTCVIVSSSAVMFMVCQGPSQLCHPAQFRLGRLYCSHRPLHHPPHRAAVSGGTRARAAYTHGRTLRAPSARRPPPHPPPPPPRRRAR